MEKDFYTVQEAAQELGVADVTVRGALYEERLPFTLMYGRKLISRADLDAYKQRTRPGGEKPRGRPRGSRVRSSEGQRIAQDSE